MDADFLPALPTMVGFMALPIVVCFIALPIMAGFVVCSLQICNLKYDQTDKSDQEMMQLITGSMPEDPYKQWWEMTFEPEKDNKSWSYLSSNHYSPVLLQVGGGTVVGVVLWWVWWASSKSQ